MTMQASDLNNTAPAVNNTPQATPQPKVDIEAITKNAVDIATKAATDTAHKVAQQITSDRMKQAASILTGEPQVSPQNQVLEQFVADPLKALHTVKEMAKSEVKRELKEETDSRNRVVETQRKIGMPFINEYPEVNQPNRMALVEKLTDQHLAAGKPYEEALKAGFEDTIKEFNITSVSEAQKNGQRHGLPSGGGMGFGAPRQNEEKAQTDFVSGMRSKMTSFRKKG